MWFESLTGFDEQSPEQVRQHIRIDGDRLISDVNGRAMVYGELEIPSLAELRQRVQNQRPTGTLSVRQCVADVQQLHADATHSGALFQVASQFNLLEMISPNVTPERGVGVYQYDRTQGPACAVAAGAGTIYRNYFVDVDGQIGQSASKQIDCLADIGDALGNSGNRLWEMRNGYALASVDGLTEIGNRLRTASETERDQLRQLLRIGLQWHTEVTLSDIGHTVSQAYCSALPVAYSGHASGLWIGFARLTLDAAYEATFCASILNAIKTGNNKLFLTLLGGGAFGNESAWILAAIRRSLDLYRNARLDVAIVSYGAPNPAVQRLISEFNSSWQS